MADGSEYSGTYGFAKNLPPLSAKGGGQRPSLSPEATEEMRRRIRSILKMHSKEGSELSVELILELIEFHHAKAFELIAKSPQKPHALAFETLPCLSEVIAVVVLMTTAFPTWPYYISVSIEDAATLRSKESLTAAASIASETGGNGIIGFGVNCCHPEYVEGAITKIHAGCRLLIEERSRCLAEENSDSRPSRQIYRFRIIVYPNSGEGWDAEAREWVTMPQQTDCCQSTADAKTTNVATGPATPSDEAFAHMAKAWVASGASVVGGCCRTTAKTIDALRRALQL